MRILAFYTGLAISIFTSSQASPANLSGNWQIDPSLSSAIDPWRRIVLDIEVKGKEVTIEELVTTGRRYHSQTYVIDLSRKTNRVPVDWWTGNRHIGAFMGGDGKMEIRGEWIDGGKVLKLESNFVVETNQGESPIREYTDYRLSRDGQRLTRLTLRSSRPIPITHVFTRK